MLGRRFFDTLDWQEDNQIKSDGGRCATAKYSRVTFKVQEGRRPQRIDVPWGVTPRFKPRRDSFRQFGRIVVARETLFNTIDITIRERCTYINHGILLGSNVLLAVGWRGKICCVFWHKTDITRLRDPCFMSLDRSRSRLVQDDAVRRDAVGKVSEHFYSETRGHLNLMAAMRHNDQLPVVGFAATRVR